MLNRIDGLAFDTYGNLFGTLEIEGDAGGVVYIDRASGAVTKLVTGITRADQLDFTRNGNLFVTSEIWPAQTEDRLWHVEIRYDASRKPVTAVKSSVNTSIAIDVPEGLVVLDAASDYGAAGEMFVAEDKFGGRVIRVSPGGAAAPFATDLARPEGLAFGDFAGAATPALYVAEAGMNRVLQIDSSGAAFTVGNPDLVALTAPDNLEFGPDGYLYVSEDLPMPWSRLVRIDHEGHYEVFAKGFAQAQGLAFDPASGDLYVVEQDRSRVWRVIFGHLLPGDYDRNGVVDARDYILWRRAAGQNSISPAADGNADGQIDSGDYDIWRTNFAQNAPEPPAVGAPIVPEPTVVMILVGIYVTHCLRYSARQSLTSAVNQRNVPAPDTLVHALQPPHAPDRHGPCARRRLE